MLGVSRGTLRSALRRLEESGEIVRRQGSGTFVGRMAIPGAFGERLERLEPYSSVAARRGLKLTAVDIDLQRRPPGEEASSALGIPITADALTVSRTLLADGTPVAVMFDVVAPGVPLPPEDSLVEALGRGQMVLDLLIQCGVPVSYARTRVMPALLSGRARAGRALGVRGTTAGLDLEELIFAGREERVAYSRDLFAPGGFEVMVIRSLASPRPARISQRRASARTSKGTKAPGAKASGAKASASQTRAR